MNEDADEDADGDGDHDGDADDVRVCGSEASAAGSGDLRWAVCGVRGQGGGSEASATGAGNPRG